ncbi:MAG: 50S ribosomal protein L23 [Elusimicrobiota bacterium]|nr:50S ribosomal protein L23 [Endomicrobiia bacterium]MDW8166680.1 50S ribosomal protein L23 [Elusimicrobiota bacterium]
MSVDIFKVLKRPIITEKTTKMRQQGVYVFEVDKSASKPLIKEAVEKIFNVDVVDVRTITMRGKLRRYGRYEGYKSDWKKAIVKIKQGQTIKLIDELQ